MLPPVDTKSATAVAAFIEAKFEEMYPGASLLWLKSALVDVERLVAGRHPECSANDVGYHDLEHTLQATVCLVQLLEGRKLAKVEPRIDARGFELAVSAALLHDSGYMKHRSDRLGTGAKYTFCHVVRSCAFAASYLPTLGANDHEVETVLSAINCTGPDRDINRIPFRTPVDRLIGSALATADYLAQMAAPDYPDELEILYAEFEESDNFVHLPPSRRAFKSAEDLKQRTTAFWQKFVLPKLESDFQAVYRFLARPCPHGPNAYLEAVESNLAEIRRRNAAGGSSQP